MTLPLELQNIFNSKNKSYKMVLTLSLLQQIKEQRTFVISLNDIKREFLSHFQRREQEQLIVDPVPESIGHAWTELNVNQISSLIVTPIIALSSLIVINKTSQTISLTESVQHQWSDQVAAELKGYAEQELDKYYQSLNTVIPLREYLQEIMSYYLDEKSKPFANNRLGQKIRQTIPSEIKSLPFIDDPFIVSASVGMGNWARIPWIAIMYPSITRSTQKGEYIVYLFSEEMNSVYLTLAQGVTDPNMKLGKKEGHRYLLNKANEMRESLPLEGMQKDGNIHLTSHSGLGRDYQASTVAYYKYDRDSLPDNQTLIDDLNNVIENYKLYIESLGSELGEVDREDEPLVTELQAILDKDVHSSINLIKAFIQQKGFTYPNYLVENFYLSLKTKPFVILAGISGTGKTKLVKLFAEAMGATEENHQFTLIPVRPDWSDPSDLIGYEDLGGQFRSGKISEVLLEASKLVNKQKPFFICLDEMNLARVEHYFSDMLSILETQRWRNEDIVTDTVIASSETGELSFPDNVFIIGTVNMDETTHPFSKKVLDRANTLEFNYIRLQDYPESQTTRIENAQLPATFLRSDYLVLQDAYGKHSDLVKRTTDRLVKVNDILEDIHSHIGFRVRDAVCFFLIYNERFGLLTEDQALDFQLLQKILPRIQGSNQSVKRVIIDLFRFCEGRERGNINELMMDASELYKPWRKISTTPPQATFPESARKLAYMLRRLEEDGFTSFWLS